MIKNEAKFQNSFGHFLKKKWTEGTAAFELKFARGNRLYFSKIQDHQLAALRLVSHRRLYFKIPDSSFIKLPFDCILLQQQPAYVVIQFEVDKKNFYMLSIEVVDGLMKDGYRSITIDDCDRLGRKFNL